MSILSEIEELEQEIEECEEALLDLENEEEIIRGLYKKIKDEAEVPVKSYDMALAGEYRGMLESESENTRYKIYGETLSAQKSTLQLLQKIEEAKERIRKRIKECKRRIEHLKAELEAQSNNNAEQKDG